MKVEIILGIWNINARGGGDIPVVESRPPLLFLYKSTKVNYFSLKEFERLEASGRMMEVSSISLPCISGVNL